MLKPSAHRHAIRRGPLWALLLAAVASPWTTPLQAQTNDNREPTLRERLTLGLHARRPAEIEYIDAVVDTVNRGMLPEKVVNRMFFWSRSRSPKGDQSRRPIIYFQAGLDRVAKSMHIKIESDPEPGASVAAGG
jgi:hypothetical protein